MGLTLLEHMIALIAPLECHICQAENYMLCPGCKEELLLEEESRCYICNKLTKSNLVCKSCSSSSRLRRVWWLGVYEKTLKELILHMKFQRRRAFAHEFGKFLAQSLPYLPESTLVVPVPTASARVRMRGYDQAVYIAKGFAESRGLRLTPLLTRTTQADQIGKRRLDRLKQMKNSFKAKNINEVKGASILLIDDVLTTGATLESAATVLREHGAKHVDAAVIARHLIK